MKGNTMTKRKLPSPAPQAPAALPPGAIGKIVDTVMGATRRPGGAATLPKELVDLANQPKNPGGR